MLTSSNYLSVQNAVMGNISSFFPAMMSYKSSIQREVIDITTPQELNDIRDCRLNLSLVDKLAKLGKQHFQASDMSDTSLYCVCMAIGTIIKEYDWGTDYIQQEGMLKLATKVSR